ncbi:hypothetical protein AB1Y20_007937 [Prymnesium parvum]|uniref:rRNA-processing protein EBP2 n=1 Tax=Prymnesium parvum TaxID=97485 RepID=A0AB34ISA6_PRYPA
MEDDEALALRPPGARAKELVNEAALQLKLQELRSTAPADADAAWLESLAVTASAPLPLDDAEDDLKRELAFYNQALAAVKEAQQRFVRLGVPHVRPDDYFAEMVKSDNHMIKVKRRMVNQQQEIVEQEARRKQKANKKFGKQVQRETLTARAQQKKREIAEVSKLRKAKKNKAGGDGLDINVENEAMPTKKGIGGGAMSQREFHDKKFGKHRRDKRNTAESATDMRDFNRGGKTFGKGGKGAKGKGGKGSSGKGGAGKGGRGGGGRSASGGRGGATKTIKKRPGKDARKTRK